MNLKVLRKINGNYSKIKEVYIKSSLGETELETIDKNLPGWRNELKDYDIIVIQNQISLYKNGGLIPIKSKMPVQNHHHENNYENEIDYEYENELELYLDIKR